MPVAMATLGCRLNAAESEWIEAAARDAGRDLAIVNTCAVTAEAARQSRQAARRLHRERPDRPVVVTGCAAEIERERFAAMPEVTALVDNAAKLRPQTWRSILQEGDSITAGAIDAGAALAPLPDRTSRTRAVLPVQTGCDHRCTFCVIPFGRGPSRSTPPGDVVGRAAALVADGTREIVLTGVDLTAYGRDLRCGTMLGGLVRLILREVPRLDRLRLSSIDSVEADRELKSAFAAEPRLMPHLHLSLQAGDDIILKRMKRRHSRADAIAFCKEMRTLRPGMVFGADIIVGFPTETEAMFGRSLDLVEACGLTHLHVFPFSPRPGTSAAKMPPVAQRVVDHRAAKLREAGRMARSRHLDGEVGTLRTVLAEADGTGRTEGFDRVRLPNGVGRGELIDVRIAAREGQMLIGRRAEPRLQD